MRRLIALKRCVSSSSVSIFSSSRAIFAFGASVPRSFSSAWPTESLVVSAKVKSSAGEVEGGKDRAVAALLLPAQFQGHFITERNGPPLHAFQSHPNEGSTHADTINAGHTRAARFADSGDHAVRLLDGRNRNGLRR